MTTVPRSVLLAAASFATAAALISDSFDPGCVTDPELAFAELQPGRVIVHPASLRSTFVVAKPSGGPRCLVIAERDDMSAMNVRADALRRSAAAGVSPVYRPPPSAQFQQPSPQHAAVLIRFRLKPCHWTNALKPEEYLCAP